MKSENFLIIPRIHGPFVVQISQKTNTDFVMGYALNLCKIHLSVVPYNQNVKEKVRGNYNVKVYEIIV